MKRIPYTKEDFTWTHWKPSEIEQAVESLLTKKRENYTTVKKIPAQDRTFGNTVYAIAETEAEEWVDSLSLIMNVNPEVETRAAAEKAIKRLSQELVDIEFDPGLYRAVKEYADHKSQLGAIDQKLLDDMLKNYRRMGFELPEEKQTHLKDILKKLNNLQTDFDLNINNYKDCIWVSMEDLAGFPMTYIQNLEKNEQGLYKISLVYPELVPFMKNCANPEKRRELADKNAQKGGDQNLELLNQILMLRKEIATVLGYASYSDFALEELMAKTSERVRTTLEDLRNKLKDILETEDAQLVDIKRRLTNDPQAMLTYFDFAYYEDQLQKELFNFDAETIREYLPLEKVIEGMFTIFGRLYSVQFQRQTEIPVWHPDAQAYEVKDADGSVLGHLFLDMFPRENKYGHAACWPVRVAAKKGYQSDEYGTGVSVVVMNVSKPSGDLPSLLSHRELETLFHEFGHALHNLLTTAPYATSAGTAVATDFVEVPSQIQENWVWDKESLDLVSGHYKTLAKIPSDMLDNLIRSKRFMIGASTMSQVFFSSLDQVLHSADNKIEPNPLYRQMYRDFIGVEPSPVSKFPAGFSHLMGMSARYYSYVWSRVIAADMFGRFKQAGILNPAIGKEYRDKVLAVGSSRDEMETVKDFLGREPNNKAFLEELGLKE